MIDKANNLNTDDNVADEIAPEDLKLARDALRSFFSHYYKGEWSIKDPLDIEKLQSSFENQNGIVIVSTSFLKV